IEHQPTPERFASHTAAGPASVNRQLVVVGVLHTRDNIFRRSWADDAQRRYLIDARITGIQLNRQLVTENVADDYAPQVVLNAFSFYVHGLQDFNQFYRKVQRRVGWNGTGNTFRAIAQLRWDLQLNHSPALHQ